MADEIQVVLTLVEIGWLMAAGTGGKRDGLFERARTGDDVARGIYRKLKSAAIDCGVKWVYGDPWDIAAEEARRSGARWPPHRDAPARRPPRAGVGGEAMTIDPAELEIDDSPDARRARQMAKLCRGDCWVRCECYDDPDNEYDDGRDDDDL